MSYIYQKPLNGENIGIVFGSFAPLHQGHLDLIMRAKKENDGGCIVIVCGYDGDKGEPLIPHHKRYRYVREFFSDDDMVAVYAINDTKIGIDKYPNGWDGWMEEFFKIYSIAVVDHNNTERHWYVAEHDYYYGLEYRDEKATFVDRRTNPISATMIRENPIKYWEKIANPFKRAFSHNILITGTASEGKSVLTQDLGKYFNAPYSYEYPRNYMEDNCIHDTELDGLDFLAFLHTQYELNKSLINSPLNKGVFFADSDALVTKMYAEYYMKDENCRMTEEDFKAVAEVADTLSRKCRWDKIFVLVPHGKFVDDHSRYMEHAGENERWDLCTLLLGNITNLGLQDKVTILDGSYYENFLTIKKYVEEEVFKNER